MDLNSVNEASSVETRLDILSLNALKKIAATLGVRSTSSKQEGFTRPLAAYLGSPAHRSLLERTLDPDEWAFLAHVVLLSPPVRLRALVLPWRGQGLDADAALEKVARLFSLGCLLPYEFTLPYGSARQHLGIEINTLRTLGTYATFTVTPAVAGWSREHGQASLTLTPTDAPASVAEPRQTELHRAVFLILAEAQRKPLKLTAKGSLYKSELTRVASALANVPVNASKGSKRRTASVAPSPLLWFAIAALQGANLLVEKPDGLYPAEDIPRFFAASPEEQSRRLIQGWLNGKFNEFPRIPTLAGTPVGYWGEKWTRSEPWFAPGGPAWGPSSDHVLQARALILNVLKHAVAPHPDAWFRIDDLARLVYEHDPEFLFTRYEDYTVLTTPSLARFHARGGNDTYPGVIRAEAPKGKEVLHRDTDWLEVEGAFVREVIAEPFLWLGLVEVGPEEPRPDRFRLTALARHLLFGTALPVSESTATTSGPPARVQPNFEVVVLDAFANAPLAVRLDSFAERQSFDRAATYRLTQDALIRGLDRGLTGDEIIAFLESISGGLLPQNVDYTLREWIRLYLSLTVHEVTTMLEADSAAQLDRWLADPEISPLLGRRLGPATVLVPSRHATRLVEIFRARKSRLRSINYTRPVHDVFTFIEPDRVVVAAEQLEPYLEHRLTRFAEETGRVQESGKEKVIYRITPDSVRGATATGWKATAIADYLSAGSSTGVPVDFYARLHGWAGAIRPLRFEPLVAVYLPSEPVGWDVLGEIPSIEPLIRLLPTPSLALISPKDLDKLRSELAIRGLDLESATLSIQELGELPPNSLDDLLAERLLRSLGGGAFGELAGLRILPGPRGQPR